MIKNNIKGADTEHTGQSLFRILILCQSFIQDNTGSDRTVHQADQNLVIHKNKTNINS